MKLSRASAYALHALVYLARHDETANTTAHDMAGADGTPELFLRKALKHLVDARLLHSLKGPHGGYRLARPAEKITLLQIVEAVDGPLRAEAPQASEEAAFDRRLQAVCEDVARLVRPVLEAVTLADLAAETNRKAATKKSTRRKSGGT
jgi:Rrf2 family protein